MDIQAILKQVSPEEGARIKVLHNANLVTLKAYSTEPSKKNLENWQAAEAAYNAELEKYKADDQPEAEGSVAWSAFEDTANKQAVLRFLVAAGYQVAERTFYRHCKKGQLSQNENGLYTRRLVKAYAIAALLPPAGEEKTEDLESIKARLQIKKLEDEIARSRFADGKDRKRYIKRDEIDHEMAARAVVLDSGTEHLFRTKAREWCVLVGGDPERAPELVEALLGGWHALLNRYASTEEFTVIFEMGEEG